MKILDEQENAVNRVSETDAPTPYQEASNLQYKPVIERAAAILADNPGMARSEALRRVMAEIGGGGELRICRFEPDDLARLDGGAPCALSDAARLLGKFAQEQVRYSRFGDSFSSFSESVADTNAVFRLCRTALDFLEADFRASEAENVGFMRRETAKLEAMAPKTPEERVADAYWTAMEQLNAAGLDFDSLASYHDQKDGEVEA